ncbi:Flp pilus assembly protein CpaB [Sphingomonas qomolangmaensis]|uniref:Flp pilus assembly protein CpaB n=1 Tax=Sphingomonas qomolangmaensis TaxID=2918765 RepID=A0ABY5L6E9_9SPHN|nr:Flp pilus assembly protein CpaB [Sphingomonas qomolangmaensis]UUL81394.1 Flp pilus assembly protein CpaB [Sphingomonas qomolangmaensis]
MDGRKIILLVGALVIAAVTAFMARTLMQGSAAPVAGAQQAAPVSSVKVLVATRALPVGTILGPESMKFQPWPEELIQNAYHLEGQTDLKALQGTVVRFAVPAGQPIAQGSLVRPGDRGFLAAALGPGMRAVTVPVSAQSAVAGFVFPGDRVDLILTQSVPGGGDGEPLKASETVLRNLRVLATDQRVDNQTDEAGKTVVSTYSTVTVEVTPKIAEKIAVAQTVGDLSLSLRSIADNATELEEAIASGEVSMPETDDPRAEKAMLARLAARPIEARSSVSTGADISRFQRSSVPGRPPVNAGVNMPPAPPVMPGMVTAQGPVAVTMGPVVRVSRGTSVTAVEVGGKK